MNVQAWIPGAIAVLIIVADRLVWFGQDRNRLASIEKRHADLEERIQGIEENLQKIVMDLRTLVENRHDRLRHDMNNLNQKLDGVLREGGISEARHEENRRTLDHIQRQLEGLLRGR